MIWAYAQAIGRRLMAWSLLSVIIGVTLGIFGDSFWRAFGIQCLVWGAIDGVIAGFGLRSAAKRARPPEVEARNLRRLLWVNTGLDGLYIAAGLWLIVALGDEWRGHGWGIILQGAFLLIFDAVHAWRIPAEQSLPAIGFFTGPEHQSFSFQSSGTGAPAALLVHGFPGTPAEMRALGESLHRAGWSAHGVLLPGFGPDIPTLGQRRYDEWVRAVEAKLLELKRAHSRVALIGYSFGGGLSVEVAARIAPDGLVLLAPFAWTETLAQRVLVALASPLLPHAFRPYRRANFDDPKFRHTMTRFMGGADLDDPALRQALRELAVPATLLQEVRHTRRAYRLARQVRAPVLVVQGERDEVSRPANTQRLVNALPSGVRYVRVEAGHDLIEPTSPGWPEVERTVLEFATRTATK
jgi:carboxylesterase